MELFATRIWTRQVITTSKFKDSEPITPREALTLIRSKPYDAILSPLEYRPILDYLLACCEG